MVVLSAGGTPLYIVDTSSRFGFNRYPLANEMELTGDASKSAPGDWLANSDAAIKTEVETVASALDTLDKVRLVSFRYTNAYRSEHPCIEDRMYLNVIAQEFREVFPDYVQSSGETLPDGREILQVDPFPLTIYAAAAVQELHKKVKQKDGRIAELRDQNEANRQRIEKLESRLARLEALLDSGA